MKIFEYQERNKRCWNSIFPTLAKGTKRCHTGLNTNYEMIANYTIQLAQQEQNSLLTETIRHFMVIQTQTNKALMVLNA